MRITNKAEFTRQLIKIATERLEPVLESASKSGYQRAKDFTPETTGSLKPKLSQTSGTSTHKNNSRATKGFSFFGVTDGEKEALRRMEYGYQGFEPTDTPEMQNWLSVVVARNPALEKYLNANTLMPVGFNYNSSFYGGKKNPIQYGFNEAKRRLESDLKVKFRKVES